MATGMKPEEDGAYKDYIMCVFCHDPIRPTKLLSCFHPVCDICMTSSRIVKKGCIKCAKCTTVTHVVDNSGTDKEPYSNLKQNTFQNVWSKYEALFQDKPCKVCSARNNNTAKAGTSVCLECGEDYLCEECLVVHATLGGTAHHQPVPIPNLKDPEYSKKLRARHHVFCEKHKIRTKFYCLKCEILACTDCLQIDHFAHERITMEDLYNQRRLEAELLNRKLRQKLDYAKWQKTEFENLVQQARVDEDAGVNEIVERVNTLKTMLDEWGKKKVYETRVFYQTLRQKYETDASNWNLVCAPLPSITTFADHYLKYASDKEILQSLNSLKEGMEDALKGGMEEGSPLMHRTEQFKWRKLEEFQSKLDQLVGEAEHRETLIMRTAKMIESPGQERITGLALTEELDILAVDGAEIYVFNASGSHKPIVTKPKDPLLLWDVATHDGDVYVSDGKLRQVKRIDKDGKTTHTIKLRGNKPSKEDDRIGVAVDPRSGLLYLCSYLKNTIYKCALQADKAEPLISPETKPKLCKPHYLHITHNGDIVTINSETRNVHIYSNTGKIKLVLGKKGSALVPLNGSLGVGTDAMGYTYVAEQLYHGLQVVSPNQGYIESFLREDEAFKDPCALTVNEASDVLVSHSINKISVFRSVRKVAKYSM